MALLRFFKPVDGLPDPKGSLSISLPSGAIASANREVLELSASEVGKKRGPYKKYSPEERFEIGQYASNHGITAAARYFSRRFQRKVRESTVQYIKKDYISNLRQKRAASPDDDDEGDQSVLRHKKRGRAHLLLKRMDFVQRRATTAKSKHSIADFSALKKSFLQDVVATVTMEEIPAELIMNWDQTGIKLVPSSPWTMEK